MKTCPTCLGVGKVYTDAERQVRARRKRIAKGLCGRCGKRKMAPGSKSRCRVCLKVNAMHQRNHNARKNVRR